MTGAVTKETTLDSTLPGSWEWVSFDQLGEVIGGLTKNRKREAYPLRLPYLRVANVYANELRLDNVEEIGVENSELDRVLLENEDLLVVEGNGSPDQIGRVALWDGSISPCVHQNHLIKVRFYQTNISRYALHWLLSSKGREHIKRVASSTSGLYTLSLSKVKALPIPLPPFNEQRRIVAKIEELFTKLDAGVRSLEQTRALLKSYRRSVLKAAVEGELSHEWREAHRGELELASTLSQSQDRAQLLHGWDHANLAELAATSKDAIKRGPFGSTIKKEYFVPAGYKVYEQKNAIYDDCSLGKYYIDEKKFEELSRFRVQRGDILMSCSGTIGKVTVVPENYEEGIINQALLKITLNTRIVLQQYFKYLFRVKLAEVLGQNTRGSAMKNIASVKVLKEIQFPLPSLQEQQFILSEIERCLSIIDKLEATVEENLKQAGGLRQSILKRAFSGKLVPQDPDDEPAGLLLARIRAEREAAKPKAGRARPKRNDEAQGRLI